MARSAPKGVIMGLAKDAWQYKIKVNITTQEIILSAVGAVIMAAGINWFVVPSGIYNGGVLGISQLINTFSHRMTHSLAGINITSIVYYLLNLPLFVLAYKGFSRNFFLRNVMCVTVETIALALIPTPRDLLVESEITSAIIGGLIAGYGAGLIFRSRSSAGGTDIIGMYISRTHQNLSVGKLSLIINIFIYTVCALTMNVTVAIYSIIYSVCYNTVIDHVHEQNICTEMTIFTKKDPEKILKFITDDLHHSANYWNAVSAYSHDQEYIIYTVVSKYDAHKLDAFLKNYDEHVFAVKSNGVAYLGRFHKYL